MLAAFDNFLRLVAALLFWKLSAFLANGRFAAAISRFDPYTFLLFCTHVMMMWLIAPVIGPLFGRFGEPGYPIFLLMLPIMALAGAVGIGRSEEHTSELQSLMRISYAVFCLKKKINKTTH